MSFLQTSDFTEILIVNQAQGKITVRMGGKDVIVTQAAYQNEKFTEYYVGGVPQDIREK